jgi:hypothetical protein
MQAPYQTDPAASPPIFDPMENHVSPIQKHQERVMECFDENMEAISKSRERISQLHEIAAKNDYEINNQKTLLIAIKEQMKCYKAHFLENAERIEKTLDIIDSQCENFRSRAAGTDEDLDHLDNFSSGYHSSYISENDASISEKNSNEEKDNHTPPRQDQLRQDGAEEPIIKEFLYASPESAAGEKPNSTKDAVV